MNSVLQNSAPKFAPPPLPHSYVAATSHPQKLTTMQPNLDKSDVLKDTDAKNKSFVRSIVADADNSVSFKFDRRRSLLETFVTLNLRNFEIFTE
jgi:hypothetical protein